MKMYIQRFLKIYLLIIVGYCFSQMFTLPCYAQEVSQAKQDTVKEKKKVDLEKKQEDVKILLDKIEILGRIEKPQTVFIIPGNDPTVEGIHIDRSFFKQIFRSIEKDKLRKRSEAAKQ